LLLVFGRNMLLNISFEANWQYIKERKQRRIVQNNRKENSKRIPHEYKPGDEVMIRLNPSRKHGQAQFEGQYTVARVNENGTVQLSKATPHGGHGTSTTWTNAWTDHPCRKMPWRSPTLLSKPLE
jgi:ribosomal protein L21E